MAILILVGGCVPPIITTILNRYFDYSIRQSMELTFILCIPIAVWMASKINERWHDDREDQVIYIIRYCNNDIINKPNYLYILINYDL